PRAASPRHGERPRGAPACGEDRRCRPTLRPHRAELPGAGAPAGARARGSAAQPGGAGGGGAAGLRAEDRQRLGLPRPRRGSARALGGRAPAPPGAGQHRGERPPGDAPAPAGPKTILVVDDESEIAAILVEALERDGYQTETAENGADALRRLERRGYDLVMSDTKMPVMDGIELYREMERRFPALQ